LTGGRVGIAAQAVRLSQAALDEAVAYAQDREQFDGPIADIQSIRHKLAEMWTTIRAARLLTWDAARAMDAGEDARAAASMAKSYATEGGRWTSPTRPSRSTAATATSPEFPVERFYRDAKVTTIYEGTTQIQQNVIARELLDG